MTDSNDDVPRAAGGDATRRATVETTHDDPEVVAAAVRPDNTDEMSTTVADGTVRTRVERDSSGGLDSTVDDYVVNLDVATRVVQHANRDTHDTDTS